MDWEVWGPPVAVLTVGVIVGVGVALNVVSGTVQRDLVGDLEARRIQLMEQLRSLELTKARLEPANYDAQKRELVLEAAAVLRSLEEGPVEPDAPVVSEAVVGQAIAWTAGALGFFGVAAYILVQTAAPRQEMNASQTAAQEAERELDLAERTLEKNPEDIDALNVMGHHALMRQQLQEAMDYVDKARALDGKHPHVITHLGALQLLVGMHDRAEASFSDALAGDASFAEAWIWWSVSLAQQGDNEGAKQKLEQALKVATRAQDKAAAHGLLADLEKASAPPAFTGQVVLVEGAVVPEGGVLYVYARNAPVSAGPPMAALRLARWQLPQGFVLTDGDLLPFAGGKWPDKVWVSAKLDVDGDPATDHPGDLTADPIGPISSGAASLEILLGAPEVAAAALSPGE